MPKVAFVVQRYGSEVIGGAETHARLIAEYLHHQQSWDIEIFTTTALAYETWTNHYPAGSCQVNGITVHRFPSRFSRQVMLFKIYSRIISPLLFFGNRYLTRIPLLRSLLQMLEYLWYLLQGPYSPRLLQALAQHKDSFEKVFFFTYLYYPTIYGFPLCADKAVLIPTAHDEYPLFFSRSIQILKEAQLLLVNTEEEANLIRSVVKNQTNKMLKVGVGVEAAYAKKFVVDNVHIAQQLPTQPYILYLGRVSKGKGVPQLVAEFLRYYQPAKQVGLCLVLAGVLEQNMHWPSHPAIIYLGPVTEERKVQLIRHAIALVNPSTKESLSLIVLEALALQTPIIVNASCKVLNSYQKYVRTVLPYNSPQELFQHLETVRKNHGQYHWQLELLKAQKWVLKHYSWERVLRSYEFALRYRTKMQQLPSATLPKAASFARQQIV